MNACEQRCGFGAEVYAVDRGAGGWGGQYCRTCASLLGFQVVDQLTPAPVRPFGDSVQIAPGAVVFWDDRAGWRGRVEAVNDDGTLVVAWEQGERDERMPPAMVTVG